MPPIQVMAPGRLPGESHKHNPFDLTKFWPKADSR